MRCHMQTALKKQIFHILLIISLTIFAIWFALKDDYRSVWAYLSHMSVYWMMGLALLGIMYYSMQGFIIYRLALPYKKDIRIWDGVHNAYIAAFFNGVTPLGGGQVAQTYAFRKLAIPYQNIASILWKDFFLYQSTVLVYVFILLCMRFSYALSHLQFYFFLVILGFLINASVIVMLWTMARFPSLYVKITVRLVSLLYKLRIVKNKEETLQKWKAQILYFNEEIKQLKKQKQVVLEAVGLNIIRMTIFYAIPYLVAAALHVPIPLSSFINVLFISACIHMLNALTPLPGDTGWTESAFIILFSLVIDRSQASSIMIIWRFVTYHLQVCIGGIIFLYVKSKQ